MRVLWYWLAACVLLAIVTGPAIAAEPIVNIGPPLPPVAGCDADSCVTMPPTAGPVCGVARRPVATAVLRVGERIRQRPFVRRVAGRLQRRPLLRRVFLSRGRVGCCR